MNPIGQSRSGTLPLVRGPEFRSPQPGGSMLDRTSLASAAAAASTETGDAPRLRRISGASGASQDALLRYGSAAQIRSASVSGSRIDLYV